MTRRKCCECIFRTTRDGELYCQRHRKWIVGEESMQITLYEGVLCDFQEKVNNEKGQSNGRIRQN